MLTEGKIISVVLLYHRVEQHCVTLNVIVSHSNSTGQGTSALTSCRSSMYHEQTT